MEDELEEIVRFLVSKRWPFRLHATYGESIERELAVFEKIAADNREAFMSLRWFIDHAETINEQDIKRIHALGGGIAIQHRMAYQGTHTTMSSLTTCTYLHLLSFSQRYYIVIVCVVGIHSLGEYFISRYGSKAASHSPPINLMKTAGVHIGAGTDGTRVATYNPWVSLKWLVRGKTVGDVQLYDDDNKLTRMEALRYWCVNNAWFCNQEKHIGALKVDMCADMAILNNDYFTINENQIDDIEALLTIVDGRVVYGDSDFLKEVSLSSPIESASNSVHHNLLPVWSPVRVFGGYQIASSTSWPKQEVEVDSTTSNATSQNDQDQLKKSVGAQAANPSEFFMHGHDC
jgi:predicted amidohydrolase YtcJ